MRNIKKDFNNRNKDKDQRIKGIGNGMKGIRTKIVEKRGKIQGIRTKMKKKDEIRGIVAKISTKKGIWPKMIGK